YNVRQGDNSFSLTDALNFLLTDIGDGYSYQVHGKFNSNKTLTDFGNTSIIEGLSTIKGAFGIYAIVPDNKVIHLYDKDSYVTNTRKVFRYRNDTAAVQLQYDATSIVNTVQAVSTMEQPAFSPFKVQDADSVAKWGIKEGARVESDSVTSADAMKNLASQSFVLEPSLAMTVTSAGNEDVSLGENWTVQVIENGFQTSVEVVSIVRAPFATTAVQVTLNNTRKNYLDAQKVQQSTVDTAKKNTTTDNMWVIGKVDG
ncbi:phage tail protein, partial [Bacillus anthracis]|uniref:phage tail protein n=3 Tax=Bacillota TaxID=1239 RepID=UPI002DBEDEEA